MIGNDIVDLALARKESNWKREGFLNKIFSPKKQLLIANAKNSEQMVWNLWTRKEAAYKIYNRQTDIRGFIPLQLECSYENDEIGTVTCNGFQYYTQTQVSNESIYTIDVVEKERFNQIRKITSDTKISKTNGIPFIIDHSTLISSPVSITHHGRFWEGITVLNSSIPPLY